MSRDVHVVLGSGQRTCAVGDRVVQANTLRFPLCSQRNGTRRTARYGGHSIVKRPSCCIQLSSRNRPAKEIKSRPCGCRQRGRLAVGIAFQRIIGHIAAYRIIGDAVGVFCPLSSQSHVSVLPCRDLQIVPIQIVQRPVAIIRRDQPAAKGMPHLGGSGQVDDIFHVVIDGGGGVLILLEGHGVGRGCPLGDQRNIGIHTARLPVCGIERLALPATRGGGGLPTGKGVARFRGGCQCGGACRGIGNSSRAYRTAVGVVGDGVGIDLPLRGQGDVSV